jgi:hypothetical protein
LDLKWCLRISTSRGNKESVYQLLDTCAASLIIPPSDHVAHCIVKVDFEIFQGIDEPNMVCRIDVDELGIRRRGE